VAAETETEAEHPDLSTVTEAEHPDLSINGDGGWATRMSLLVNGQQRGCLILLSPPRHPSPLVVVVVVVVVVVGGIA
jgi:hypothetical protein